MRNVPVLTKPLLGMCSRPRVEVVICESESSHFLPVRAGRSRPMGRGGVDFLEQVILNDFHS